MVSCTTELVNEVSQEEENRGHPNMHSFTTHSRYVICNKQQRLPVVVRPAGQQTINHLLPHSLCKPANKVQFQVQSTRRGLMGTAAVAISNSRGQQQQQQQQRPGKTPSSLGSPLGVRFAALVVGISLLVTLPWEKLDHEFPYSQDMEGVPDVGPQDKPRFTRSVIHISSHGDLLETWLYLPKHSQQPPPVLVMGHGMGAQKDIGLWMYAERFVEAGMAVVVFDYRGFGGSEGMPRHWVSPKRHLQDFEAVIKHIQSTNLDDTVDGSRIALWGVSYGGAHVLVTAAKFGSNISAVVANEPYVSPQAVMSNTLIRGVGRSLRLLAVGASDELRRLLSRMGFNLPPVYLRLVAPMSDPKALALLHLKDSEMAIRAKGAPPRRQGNWQNKVLARVVVEALGYNPAKHFKAIKSPIFFRLASKDHLCPPDILHALLDRGHVPESQYVIQQRNVTHLEAHASGVKEEEIRPVIAFLRKHLGLASAEELTQPASAAGAATGEPKEGLDPGTAEELAEVQFPATE